jgi:hypothetical protein
VDVLDPDSPTYALDVVSVVEATLEDPRQVLLAQQFKARGEAVAEMKADGLEYEERMELLDDVTWPKPLGELLSALLATYRQTHPWVAEEALSPKSVVREMWERAMTFSEYVAWLGLGRSEGLLLRYLSDAYRTLRQTVPDSARTEGVDDVVEWLGAVVRQTDSSLVDEWEALVSGTPIAAEPTPGGVAGTRSVTADARGFRVMVRNAMFRRVDLLARRRWEDLAALDAGLTADQWRAAGEAYAVEHGEVGIGPDARGPGMFLLGDPEDGRMTAAQILDDPHRDHDWRITATVDLDASDEAGEPVLTTLALAPLG